MPEDERPAGSLSATASRYQVRNTIYTAAAGGLQRILRGDGSRWYFAIYPVAGGASLPAIVPGPPPPALPTGATGNAKIEAKFRDAPASCTGEWWGNLLPGSSFVITEEIFLGG